MTWQAVSLNQVQFEFKEGPQPGAAFNLTFMVTALGHRGAQKGPTFKLMILMITFIVQLYSCPDTAAVVQCAPALVPCPHS